MRTQKKGSFQLLILLEIHPCPYNLPQSLDIKLVQNKSLYNYHVKSNRWHSVLPGSYTYIYWYGIIIEIVSLHQYS
jgi:hypothetical protein